MGADLSYECFLKNEWVLGLQRPHGGPAVSVRPANLAISYDMCDERCRRLRLSISMKSERQIIKKILTTRPHNKSITCVFNPVRELSLLTNNSAEHSSSESNSFFSLLFFQATTIENNSWRTFPMRRFCCEGHVSNVTEHTMLQQATC